MSSPPDLTPVARRLEGKVAIITGGASGIGECTARLFWAHGAKVVIGDIQDELGHAICRQLDSNISYFHCDVSNEDEVCKLVNFAVEKYGKLDIMHNNAGTVDLKMTSILTAEKASIERVLQVNLVGAMLGAKHAARVMVPARKGCILFTTSSSAIIKTFPEHAYVASKGGILVLARNVAGELGQYGIRVNCVSPYGVATKIVEGLIPGAGPSEFEKGMDEAANLKGVTLKTHDVAYAALYLASDEARYVSGLNLVVDGGYSVTNPSMGTVISKML